MKTILSNSVRRWKVPLSLIILLSPLARAGTVDEIKALYHATGVSGETTEQSQGKDPAAVRGHSEPIWYRLSNGRKVNLGDWKVVLFMQGHCPYCHQFDPVLRKLSAQLGFSIFTYTLDGQGDLSFPEALPAPPEVMKTFFPDLPVATPTTFLVNVKTLEAFPLLQGATSAQGFITRLNSLFLLMEAPKIGR